MNLVKTNPLATARHDIDRVFDRFFGGNLLPEFPAARAFEAYWEPNLDFSETEKEYVVRVEVPGMNRDDLDVTLDGNMLTLSGRKEFRKDQKGEDFLWQERAEGRFMRTLRVPGALTEDKIAATYDNGVLTVRLPKSAIAPKSKIAIK